MRKLIRYRILFISSITLAILFLANCSSNEQKATNEENSAKVIEPAFVGDATCKSCHQEQHADWHNSHHDWAMKLPNDSTVFGNFDSKEVNLDEVQYHFYKKEDEFWVDVKEEDQTSSSHKIAYTFGYQPLQQYLIEGEKGEVHTLRATWDTEGSKWYHQYAGDKIAPNDWLHWTKGGQRWNTMCASCHSTDLHKNYDIEKRSFNTTFKTINVGCESCHGKGAQHVEWARSGDAGEKHNGCFSTSSP